MPLDPKSLTPEQQQRLFDELRQDQEFLKTRNMLLVVTVMGGICLFVAGWMMLKNMVTLLDMISIMALLVFANVYLVRRLSGMQKIVLERWQKDAAQAARQEAFNPGDDPH